MAITRYALFLFGYRHAFGIHVFVQLLLIQSLLNDPKMEEKNGNFTSLVRSACDMKTHFSAQIILFLLRSTLTKICFMAGCTSQKTKTIIRVYPYEPAMNLKLNREKGDLIISIYGKERNCKTEGI